MRLEVFLERLDGIDQTCKGCCHIRKVRYSSCKKYAICEKKKGPTKQQAF